MTDNLRDRIETILGNAAAAQVGHLRGRIDVRAMAEALIRELPQLQPCPFCKLSHNECGCMRTTPNADPLSAQRLRECAETMDAYWASVGEEYDGDTLREEADAIERYIAWTGDTRPLGKADV